MNSTIEVLRNRTSLRKYREEQIKKEDLDLIIEAAMKAPTAGNMMLYSIIVVQDEKKKNKLSKTCDNQPFIAKAPTILIFLADMQRWFDYYEFSDVKGYCLKNNVVFEGPDEGDFVLAMEDAMIAAENAVIAAESLGIGSCYIGDIIENYEVHKEMLNLPDWVAPISMLCLGYYPEGDQKLIKPRFDKKFIVFNETYKRFDQQELDEMFMDRNKSFTPNNKFNAENFGQLMYARKTGSEFSKEMTRSIRLILESWGRKK